MPRTAPIDRAQQTDQPGRIVTNAATPMPLSPVPFPPSPVPRLLLPFLLLTSPLAALDFKTFAFDGHFTNLFYMQGETEMPIDVNGFRISKPYSYNSSSPLIFYTHTQDEAGEQVRTPAAQLPYDPRSTSLLLLFAPVPTGGYQVYPIANDNASHPPGAYRIQNLTQRPIALRIDKQDYQFTPNQLQVIAPPPPQKRTIQIDPNASIDDLNVENPESVDAKTEPGNLVTVAVPSKIPVQMAYLHDGEWFPAYNRKWLYRADIRTYVFAHERNNTVMLKQYVEFLK